MKIGIDYDGVILSHKDIPSSSDWYNNKPIKNARKAIVYLLSLGHELYICTNRTSDEWDKMKTWLDMHKFPELKITNIKQKNTTIYLDDRAIRFTNWKDFTRLIK